MNPSHDLSYITFIAIQAALKAGEILRRGFGSSFEIKAKPGKQNIVTEYDHASEAAVISLIQTHFPHHSILAEESGLTRQEEDTILWIIDPLDGTTNFARHIPYFTVSIAAYYQEQAICGIIFQPLTNELFVAEKNRGAYLNGTRIKVSSASKFDEAILGGGFPYEIPENPDLYLNYLAYFLQSGVTLRNLGSAALALAYVAAGKLDGFWMDNLYPWDLAAGKILIEEAGGMVSRYDGTPAQITVASNILATNRRLHSKMLSQLNV